MIRISTIFIAICMVLIAASLGLMVYALAGLTVPESAIVALAALTFLILYTARLALPKDLYEAAGLDGASAWQQFRFLTWRLLLPAMLVAVLFRYIFAFRIFSEVWLLTQGGPARSTEVLAVYLYKQAFSYQDFGLASATGWMMVLLSLAIALYYLRLAYKRMFAATEGSLAGAAA